MEDLFFNASILHEISRHEEAAEEMKKLIKENPVLDKDERSLFLAIYKPVLDDARRTLSLFVDAVADEESMNGDPVRCEIFAKKRDEAAARLTDLCNEVLTLIDSCLLPKAQDSQAKVFFCKMRGDLFRYLLENEADEEKAATLRNDADMAYLAAIGASMDLTRGDPVRLGTILNYAVFNHEHLGKTDKAIELVKDAMDSVGSEFDKMSDNAKAELLSIVSVMKSNLTNWEGSEEDE